MWEENAKKYKEAILDAKKFELKGKAMLYTSSKGYMFSQLNKAGELGIRLSKEDMAAFHNAYTSSPFKSYGAIMKEYVLIPQDVLENTTVLANWLLKGFQYVNTLKPK